MARETAVPAIVLGAVTSEDAAAVNLVVDADQDAWTARRSASPAARRRSMPDSASGAVRLPSSLDEAVAVVAAVDRARDERRTAR